MPTIMISIMPDGMPVDQMLSDDDDGPSCPLPTQDEELNTKNKDVARFASPSVGLKLTLNFST